MAFVSVSLPFRHSSFNPVSHHPLNHPGQTFSRTSFALLPRSHRFSLCNHRKMKDTNTTTLPAANATPTDGIPPALGTDATAPVSALPQKRPAPVPTAESLRIVRLHDAAVLPERGSELSAGYDLAAGENAVVTARGRAVVKTGLKVAIPQGCYGRVAPRSGLAVKKGIDVGAGVIDADYRGELGVVLFNFGNEDFSVKPGDRIAQLVIERIATPPVVECAELDDTARGEGGFGSTGVDIALKQAKTN